ncbi:hypothetical protein [Acrocarpospora sp. B8E8]|uniref:hypothetical protein n=1 Tax=Acrocarpospora sp. B8E8 TaxID=3153572 RepID=UPI00325F430E
MRPPTWCGPAYKGAMKHRRGEKRLEAEERQEAEQLRAEIQRRDEAAASALTIASSR